ncbi:MAG: histidine kinase [Flavobacteriales bacterium]|nr:histidine kinase [Flavobacteriales bacterium]
MVRIHTYTFSQVLFRCGLLLTFCLWAHQSFSQRFFIKNFAAKEGLSQSEVGNIVQAKDGRMYLTTAAFGVDVFDGMRFHTIGTEQGLIHPYIADIHRDEQDHLWFFSTHGINRMEEDSMYTFPLDKDALGIESIFDVFELGEDEFLLGTDVGLIHFRSGNFTLHQHPTQAGLRFFDIEEWKDIHYLATSHGLFTWENAEIQEPDDYPLDEEILSLGVDASGRLLMGVSRGYYQADASDLSYHPLFEDERYSVICFLTTREGSTIAGTNGVGMFFLEEGLHITEKNGLSEDFIWTLYQDMDDNIWIGTSGAGLDLMAHDHFRTLTTADGLGSDIVYDILQREDGSLWFGMVQGGITVWGDEEHISYDTEDGLSHQTVRCFLDSGDTLFIGTEGGLTIFTRSGFEDVSSKFGVEGHAIFDIHRDRSGVLWFACKGERYYGENGGVVRYAAGRIDNYTLDDGLPSNNVYCIRERPNGDLWFGTTGGVGVWDGETFSRQLLDGPNSCQGTVLTMLTDHKGNDWIGGVNGLGLLTEDGYTCISGNGIRGETIYFLATQGDSILWVGSAIGLEKIDLEQFYDHGEIHSELFNDDNGFIGTECNQNAVTVDDQGNFWFGTIGGAVQFIPSLYDQDDTPLRLRITSVRLGGRDTHWSDSGWNTDTQGIPQDLQLNYKQNSVQFEYLAIHLTEPDLVEYSFMLEGTDDGWSAFSPDRSVFFANLGPQEYIFKVRARNSNTGIISNTVAYPFIIEPAIWQTLWFQLLLIGLVLFGIFSFFYWRIQNIRRHEEEKRRFQEELAELEMTALRAQMNPHFLFNSLNSVNSFIIKNDKEAASEYLGKFSRLVRLILQNSKKKLVDLEDELTALRLYIQLESLRFNRGFHFIEKIPADIDLEKYHIPPLLLQPYVENAIWHGLLHLEDRQGRLALEIRKNGSGLEIFIEDNGIGRKQADLLKSKSAIKKKSLGMKLNKERMDLTQALHDFNITLDIDDMQSDEGKALGTRVRIKISDYDR